MDKSKNAWFLGWFVTRKGGPTSGNWQHKGRKGKRGGSLPGGGHSQFGLSYDQFDKPSIQAFLDAYRKERGKKKGVKPTGNVGRPADPYAGYDERGLKVYIGPIKATMSQTYGDPDFKMTDNEYMNVLNHRKDSLSYLSGIDEYTVTTAMSAWGRTSNDTDMRSLSLQEAASEELGVPLSDWQKQKIQAIRDGTEAVPSERYKPVTGLDRASERKLIRTMYNWTQDELKDAGYKPGDTIRLFRGVAAEHGAEIGTPVDLKQNAISSWSINPESAASFAKWATYKHKHPFGHILSMEVPIESIVSMAPTGFGMFREGEFVVMGMPGSQAVVVGLK